MLPGRLRNPKFSAGSIRQYSGTLGFSQWLRFTCQWSEWTPSLLQKVRPLVRTAVRRPLAFFERRAGGGQLLHRSGGLHSLRWFVSLYRDILVAAIGHMPMVRAEVAVGGLIGASARSHSGRWSDIRWWAILGAATGIPPDIPLWLERRPPQSPWPPPLALKPRRWSLVRLPMLSYPRFTRWRFASPATGQSGRTPSGKDRCVHSLQRR